MEGLVLSAIFENRLQAEMTVAQLRGIGVRDESISLVALHHGEPSATHPDGTDATVQADSKTSGAMKGLGIGAGVGVLFGLAAFAIPGVGPFITAGALAEALGVVGGAAASGAIVGGAAGTLVGALVNYGISPQDAEFFDRRIREGGILLSVRSGDAEEADRIRDVFKSYGGQSTALLT